VQTIDIYR